MIITKVFSIPVNEILDLIDFENSHVNISGLSVCTAKVKKKPNKYGIYGLRVDGMQDVYKILKITFFGVEFVIDLVFIKETRTLRDLTYTKSTEYGEKGWQYIKTKDDDISEMTLNKFIEKGDHYISTIQTAD